MYILPLPQMFHLSYFNSCIFTIFFRTGQPTHPTLVINAKFLLIHYGHATVDATIDNKLE